MQYLEPVICTMYTAFKDVDDNDGGWGGIDRDGDTCWWR